MQIEATNSALGVSSLLDQSQVSKDPGKLKEASQGFESILLRQFLGESMKSLLDGGTAGQVYGYMLTDTLADTLTKGGGMGLSSVIQAQLGGENGGKKP